MKKITDTIGIVLILLVFCVLLFFAIRNSIIAYDPEEDARYKRYAESCKRADKVWKDQRFGGEEYREWKKQEDEYQLQRLKDEVFRKRYENER